MGKIFVAQGQVTICSKTLCSLSQTPMMLQYIKGVGSQTCRISLVYRQKNQLLNKSGIALFCVPNISTFMNSTYSPVLILFTWVLNMSRVAMIFFWSIYVFDHKFDKGHSHLTKSNFDLRFDKFLLIFMEFIL